jgi:pimeloyl-ACP methyl ester carboxylesterase
MAGFVASRDGVPIAYEVIGEGTPALLFVHGWSCDRSYWAGQIGRFSRAFRVVTIDLAGHGDSGLGRTSWTMEAFGGDVSTVVEALDLSRVILIGHSMGGDVIVEAARQLSGRVVALIWADAYKQLRTPRTREQLQTFLAPFRGNFVDATRTFVRGMFRVGADEDLRERVAADMSAAPPRAALDALESAMSFDREIPGALQELRLPVIAINPESEANDIASMQRHGVEVLLMPGVGHFLMMEDAPRFNELLATAIAILLR